MSKTNRQKRVKRVQGRRRGDAAKEVARPAATPQIRRFAIQMEAEVRIDGRLLVDVLTEEWRSSFYPLHTPVDVAEHLAFNLIQGRRLSSLDGFADQDDLRATLDFSELITDVVEIDGGELSDAARQMTDDVKDAIHAASDGIFPHDQAIRALDEIIRHAAELRRAYINSQKMKERRDSAKSKRKK